MFVIVFIIAVILFFYVLRIIRYAFGWRKIKDISREGFSPSVSVVIAIRNEDEHIDFLLKSLESQIFSKCDEIMF